MQRVLPQLNDWAASLPRLRIQIFHRKPCAANATVAIRNFNPRKLDILISAINSAATDALKASSSLTIDLC